MSFSKKTKKLEKLSKEELAKKKAEVTVVTKEDK